MLALAAISLALALVGVIVYLLRQVSLERDAWRLERTGLLQRIQAPERAVVEQGQVKREPLPHIPIDDDAAFAALREARNGSGD